MSRFNQIRLQMGLDGFILALIAVIIIAKYWYQPGIYDGTITLNHIADYGVGLIFFFYGLKLNPAKLRSDLSNWKLHIVVQMTTFIIFPLIISLLMWSFGSYGNKLLWIGLFYLATLPSTVSSSVVMVSIAKGNIPSAIFNASISSLLGVFITPLWMSLILVTGSDSYNLGGVIIKLSFQVILPVSLGMLLNSKFGSIAEKNRERLKLFDQSVILLIVYLSFCESFANNMFKGYTLSELTLLSIAMAALFFLLYYITGMVGNIMKFNREDNITALFCGSKKSLVHGTVMAKVIFTGMTGIGIILLPLMIYHTLQLIFASIIARKYATSHEQTAKLQSPPPAP